MRRLNESRSDHIPLDKEEMFETLTYKIIVIGDGGVGKTQLINRFCQDVFQKKYIPTIGVDF